MSKQIGVWTEWTTHCATGIRLLTADYQCFDIWRHGKRYQLKHRNGDGEVIERTSFANLDQAKGYAEAHNAI